MGVDEVKAGLAKALGEGHINEVRSRPVSW